MGCFCTEPLSHSHLGIFTKKHFKASQAAFWSLAGYKELNLPLWPFIDSTLHSLLIQMQTIIACRIIIFSFAGHLVGFILVWKVLEKAFTILGLDGRQGRWVVEQDFHGNFQVNVTCMVFCPFLRHPNDWTMLNLVWVERSPHPAQVSRQSCPWPQKG